MRTYSVKLKSKGPYSQGKHHEAEALDKEGKDAYEPGWAEVPLRQPSARAQERARVAAVMRGPKIPIEPKGVRIRRFERAAVRADLRGPLHRPRGFYGRHDTITEETFGHAWRMPTAPYTPRPADGPPAFRRACLRGLGRFLTGPSAELRRARVQWREYVAQTISEAST